jgi:hypothetical protein
VYEKNGYISLNKVKINITNRRLEFVSYTTSVYTYTVRQIVVVLSGTSPRKYMPVYSKPLTLNKGVDNQLQFQFLNQEQKPVDLSSIATANQQISFRAINSDGTEILFRKALTPVLDVNGIFQLNTTAAEIEDISAQQAYYSLEWPSGNLNLPVFVDSKAGARGDLNFVDSILPSYVPSQTVTIPSDATLPSNTANANSEAVTFFSSIINTQDNPVLTTSLDYANYVGNVTIQGSTLVDSGFYDIDSYQYGNASNGASESGTIGYTINGYHPFIKLKFEANVGNIVTILAR